MRLADVLHGIEPLRPFIHGAPDDAVAPLSKDSRKAKLRDAAEDASVTASEDKKTSLKLKLLFEIVIYIS